MFGIYFEYAENVQRFRQIGYKMFAVVAENAKKLSTFLPKMLTTRRICRKRENF